MYVDVMMIVLMSSMFETTLPNSQVPYLYPDSYPDPRLDPVLEPALHHQSTYSVLYSSVLLHAGYAEEGGTILVLVHQVLEHRDSVLVDPLVNREQASLHPTSSLASRRDSFGVAGSIPQIHLQLLVERDVVGGVERPVTKIDRVYRVLPENHHRHVVTLTSALVDMPFEQPSSLVVGRMGYIHFGIPAAMLVGARILGGKGFGN